MNSFQYDFYDWNNQKKENEIEVFFKNLKDQIELHNNHFISSYTSYGRRMDKEIKSFNTKLDILLMEAEEIYQSCLIDNRIIGSLTEKELDSYAMQVSGIPILLNDKVEGIQNITKKYLEFIDLFNKSTLISLYSLKESKIKSLSEILSKLLNKRIKPDDFNKGRDIFGSIINYLDKVIEIDIQKIEGIKYKLGVIQKTRNKIVHSYSSISEDKLRKTIRNEFKDIEFSNNTLIIHKKTIIVRYFDLIKDLFEFLIWEIDKKQEFQILRNGLEYWLKFIFKSVEIQDIDIINYNQIDIITLLEDYYITFNVNFNKHVENKITQQIKINSNEINKSILEKLENLISTEEKNNWNRFIKVFEPLYFNSTKFKINIEIK